MKGVQGLMRTQPKLRQALASAVAGKCNLIEMLGLGGEQMPPTLLPGGSCFSEMLWQHAAT